MKTNSLLRLSTIVATFTFCFNQLFVLLCTHKKDDYFFIIIIALCLKVFWWCLKLLNVDMTLFKGYLIRIKSGSKIYKIDPPINKKEHKDCDSSCS